MKREKLFEIYSAMTELDKIVHGFKLGYALAKNLNKIKPEVEAVKQALKPSKEFTEFETKRIEASKSFAKLDDQGEPVIVDGAYDLADVEGFTKAMDTLRVECSEALSNRDKQVEEYNALLLEEIEFEFHKVKLQDVENAIDATAPGIGKILEPLISTVIEE